MLTTFLSYLLSLLLMLAPATSLPRDLPAVKTQVLWGMIDPELSLWFSRVPGAVKPSRTVLWDFSWRGFLAALFGQPMIQEASHAPLA